MPSKLTIVKASSLNEIEEKVNELKLKHEQLNNGKEIRVRINPDPQFLILNGSDTIDFNVLIDIIENDVY